MSKAGVTVLIGKVEKRKGRDKIVISTGSDKTRKTVYVEKTDFDGIITWTCSKAAAERFSKPQVRSFIRSRAAYDIDYR